eukprot:CAMPEP_0180783174 /NCGR_PEP_ID=MMETSP1038_2-20121128/48827_1 /TAXON_ID=632150 /ORGANISM="Azadinium spinosum, Strain 3D9" /LENGTH=161 /DNA_ID=CAMNT_0022819613 /DNA_START=342 /DNA_END=824 /DNA_ORIENTATION=+
MTSTKIQRRIGEAVSACEPFGIKQLEKSFFEYSGGRPLRSTVVLRVCASSVAWAAACCEAKGLLAISATGSAAIVLVWSMCILSVGRREGPRQLTTISYGSEELRDTPRLSWERARRTADGETGASTSSMKEFFTTTSNFSNLAPPSELIISRATTLGTVP